MVAFPAGYFGLTGSVLYPFGGLDHSAVNLYWVLSRRKKPRAYCEPWHQIATRRKSDLEREKETGFVRNDRK
jgi:hypothetical protein